MPSLSLGADDYKNALTAAGIGRIALFHHEATGSTNDDARNLVAADGFDPATSLALVIAERQTQGRGRGSNVWFSPEGSISFTLSVPGVDASRLGVLPLGIGVCVAVTLRAEGAEAFLKWPNDVLIGGLKVCGILCESALLSGAARVFLGIGVNVAAAGLSPEVASRATSLETCGVSVHRPALVAQIVARVLKLIKGSATNQEIVADFKSFAAPWWGEAATIVEGNQERRVTLLDVNPHGQLVVRDEAGVVRCLVSGEVRRIRAARA